MKVNELVALARLHDRKAERLAEFLALCYDADFGDTVSVHAVGRIALRRGVQSPCQFQCENDPFEVRAIEPSNGLSGDADRRASKDSLAASAKDQTN